jgi:hypothetical protein
VDEQQVCAGSIAALLRATVRLPGPTLFAPPLREVLVRGISVAREATQLSRDLGSLTRNDPRRRPARSPRVRAWMVGAAEVAPEARSGREPGQARAATARRT